MEINCEFVLYSDFYTCIVHEAEINEPEQVIKAFKGNYLSGKSNLDVKQLLFTNSNGTKLQYFPQDLPKHFPNLVRLEFNGCGIKKVSKRDLRGLENLETFWMNYCQLTSLPDNLLTNMPKLKDVSFSNNQIASATGNLLKPFVERADISVNFFRNKNLCAWFCSKDVNCSTHQSLQELMKAIDEKCCERIEPQVVLMETEDFSEGIKNLWTSGNYSDFKIISADKEFKVHRSVLGIFSSTMAEIFKDSEEATELEINDFTTIAIESMLHFIYTNEVLHEDNAKENVMIAYKFKIEKMKSVYTEIIADDLDDNNAYETFLFAHKYEAKLLKKEAFDMIVKKFSDPLPESLMEDLTKLKKLIDNRREYENLLEDQQKLSL